MVAWHARQTDVGVAWGGVSVYLCSRQLCQPGRDSLGALLPVLSPLHRPFSLPKVHLFPFEVPDAPGPPLAPFIGLPGGPWEALDAFCGWGWAAQGSLCSEEGPGASGWASPM